MLVFRGVLDFCWLVQTFWRTNYEQLWTDADLRLYIRPLHWFRSQVKQKVRGRVFVWRCVSFACTVLLDNHSGSMKAICTFMTSRSKQFPKILTTLSLQKSTGTPQSFGQHSDAVMMQHDSTIFLHFGDPWSEERKQKAVTRWYIYVILCPRFVMYSSMLHSGHLDFPEKTSLVGSTLARECAFYPQLDPRNNWSLQLYSHNHNHHQTVPPSPKQGDCLQGFQLCHSLGGGTGAGMGTLLISKVWCLDGQMGGRLVVICPLIVAKCFEKWFWYIAILDLRIMI